MASDLPKKSVEIAEGIPIKKINKVEVQTAFFLLQLSLSIKEDTGTSSKETEEVIAAIKANPKKTAAINLPNNPRFAKPVGRAINNVPTVDSLTTSFNPKLITTGNVINPANKPTAVSKEATLKASFGR